jgi:hypothetical protein
LVAPEAGKTDGGTPKLNHRARGIATTAAAQVAKTRLPPTVSRQDALSERMSDAKVAIIVDATKAAL